MAALSAIWAESKSSTVPRVARLRSGLLERRRVRPHGRAPAVEAREARGHLRRRPLEQRGDLHLQRVGAREGLAVARVDDELGQLREDVVAARLDAGELVDAAGGDEPQLLAGQRLQLVSGAGLAHATAALVVATWAQASRSSPSSRTTSETL